jgi:hypothetical protein
MKKIVATAFLVVVGLGTGLFLSQYMAERFFGNPEPFVLNNSIIVSSR